MKYFTGIFVFISFFIHSYAFGSEQKTYDCVTINQDVEHMLTLKASGEFRTSLRPQALADVRFNFQSNQPFEDYLAYAEKLVELKKPQAHIPCPINTATQTLYAQQRNEPSPRALTVKDFVIPFELKQNNNDKVIVLIHGLTDSPYSFHDLAYYFYQQGFNVRTLLLPGHGTAPSDLLGISYHDWQQAADYIIKRSLLDYEQVYLGGFSTGGALIFNHLMQQQQVSEKIKALFMWSPASKAKSNLAWLAAWVDYIPFVDWVDKEGDIDFAKYESFPFNAGAQVHKLMSNIVGKNRRESNHAHNIPLFVVASEVDQTIETKATIALMNFWQSAAKKKQPNTLMYFGDKTSAEKNLAAGIKLLIPECQQALCQHVKGIAHTGTTNAPSNPHYGAKGNYRNCGHYVTQALLYRACKQEENVVLGEVSEENLTNHLMQRLTFNPYYQQMLNAISTFIATLE